MTAKMACGTCRARKVKCDSAVPRCGRCVRNGVLECAYDQARRKRPGNALAMGEACLPCRSKKKRCDAGRPCTLCHISRRECVYDEDSSASSAPEETTPPRSIKSLVVFRGVKVCPRPSPPQPVLQSPSQPFTCSGVPLIPHPTPLTLMPKVPSEHLKISDISTSDLNLNFRLNTLRRYMIMGLRMRGDKQEAIMRGDLCGTVVNPFFVHLAHGLGMHYCATLPEGKTAVVMQARYGQLTWETLADLSKDQKDEDHFLLLEARFAMASACVLLRWLDITRACLLKAIHIANKYHMTFVPKDSPVPVFSGDVHEHIAQLSQLIYLENFLFLTKNGAEPKATSRLEKEFRNELEGSYPFIFDICPLIMRTRGILLIRDAIFVLGVYPLQTAMLKDWRALCGKMIGKLQAHTDVLQQHLEWFTSIGDKESSGVIRSNCISCLAYLANLYLTIAPTDYPTAPAMESCCDTTLSTLGKLTEGVMVEEYNYFDLLLGMCWKRATEGFKTRTSALPPEERTVLAHWWKVVADAYASYREKLPDSEPPLLSSLCLVEDGRTEDSRYPNLLSPQGRAELGI